MKQNPVPKLHLLKLSVGSESYADLAEWQQAQARSKSELVHITRHTPKRAAEILDGGSIYWVIKGQIVGRNRILELRPLTYGDQPHCGIVYDPVPVRVVPRLHRPFQGWRYFPADQAPPDLATDDSEDIPEDMLRDLVELGLM
jgi:hypothetical protein